MNLLDSFEETHQREVAEEYLREIGCAYDAETVDNAARRLITRELLECIHLRPFDDLESLTEHQMDRLASEISVDGLHRPADDASYVAAVKEWLPYVLRPMERVERATHEKMLRDGPNLL